jgi:hypothetical protein
VFYTPKRSSSAGRREKARLSEKNGDTPFGEKQDNESLTDMANGIDVDRTILENTHSIYYFSEPRIAGIKMDEKMPIYLTRLTCMCYPR